MPSSHASTSSSQQKNLGIHIMRDLIALGIAEPFKRGFFCTDETIRYPHKESTISSLVLYLSGTSTNLILIFLFEYINLRKLMIDNEQLASGNFYRLYICNTYCRIIVWLFGGISSELITDTSKYFGGRLRPHFVSLCDPLIKEEGSEIGLVDYCSRAADKYRYITHYRCTGKDTKDMRLSFMSGHSSYGAYSAMHAALYLQQVMDPANFGLLRPFFQLLFLSLAFYTGLSRISDYKHHWQDVTVGLIQGSLVAFIAAKLLWPTFNKNFKNVSRGWVGFQRVEDESQQENSHELNRVRY